MLHNCHSLKARFAPRNPDGTTQHNANITGPMLAQYLMALLGPAGRGNDPLMNLFGGMIGPSGMPPGGGEPGRWGDYVFNQEGEFCLVADISSVMFKPAFRKLWTKLSRSSWKTPIAISPFLLPKLL